MAIVSKYIFFIDGFCFKVSASSKTEFREIKSRILSKKLETIVD